MKTSSGIEIFDNTAAVLRSRGKNAAAINFYETCTPVLPSVSLDKPAVVDGEIAYGLNGGSGIAEVRNGVVTVNGSFVRAGEWSSVPWTEKDRELFSAKLRKRSQINDGNHEKTMSALRERNSLASQFARI